MKTLTLNILLISLTTVALGQEITKSTTKTITQSGIGLGSMIAVVSSWDRNKSIFWAILHAVFGWLYVIYFALTRDKYDKIDQNKRQSHLFKIDYENYEEHKRR